MRRFSDVAVQSFRPPAPIGFIPLPPSTRISDHLAVILAPLGFPLSTLLQSVTLSPHLLEQYRFPFLQERQASLAQVDVAAGRLQE